MVKSRRKRGLVIIVSLLLITTISSIKVAKVGGIPEELKEGVTQTPSVEEFLDEDSTSLKGVTEVTETTKTPVIQENIITVEKEVIKAPFKLKRVGTFKVKGYCTCNICKPIKNNPKNIREAEGVNVIADLSIIPEGTMIWLDGVGIRQVQPSSRTTKGNNIIVYFKTHEEVVKFGFKEIVAYKIMA